MPRYNTSELASQIRDRFDPDETTPRDLRAIATEILPLAQELQLELGLETEADIEDFLNGATDDDTDLEEAEEDLDDDLQDPSGCGGDDDHI